MTTAGRFIYPHSLQQMYAHYIDCWSRLPYHVMIKQKGKFANDVVTNNESNKDVLNNFIVS